MSQYFLESVAKGIPFLVTTALCHWYEGRIEVAVFALSYSDSPASQSTLDAIGHGNESLYKIRKHLGTGAYHGYVE